MFKNFPFFFYSSSFLLSIIQWKEKKLGVTSKEPLLTLAGNGD